MMCRGYGIIELFKEEMYIRKASLPQGRDAFVVKICLFHHPSDGGGPFFHLSKNG